MTPEQRSHLMSKIRGKDTAPELIVRKTLFAKGYRFRIHAKGLPGTPDIVFPSRKLIIFVHGCFWHQHKRCLKKKSSPNANRDYWDEKFDKNKRRDIRKTRQLRRLGYRVAVIWECETKDVPRLSASLGRLMRKYRTLGKRKH